MSKVRFSNATGAKTDKGMDIIQWSEYYPAESVERLVEAAREAIPSMMAMNERSEGLSLMQKFERLYNLLEALDKLKAALEPFKEVK